MPQTNFYTTSFNCTQTVCQKISNGDLAAFKFSQNTHPKPFESGDIFCWNPSHGNPFMSNTSPTLTDLGGTSTGNNTWRKDITMDAWDANQAEKSNGIFQNTSILSNRIYILKFKYQVENAFRSLRSRIPTAIFGNGVLDNFFVKFANSNNTFVGIGDVNSLPSPSGEQLLLQMTNLQVSDNLQEVTVCIKANADFNALWFYPQQNNGASNSSRIRITDINLYEVDAGGPTLNVPCSGSGFFQIGQGCANIPGATYSWSPSTGLSNPNTLNPTVNFSSFSGSRTYTLTVSMGGCSVSDSVTLIQQRPAISLPQQMEVCSSNDLPVLLVSSPDYSGSSGYGFQWYLWNNSQLVIIPGATQQNYLAPAPGVYVLVVTHFATACQNTTFSYVYLAPQNTANTDFGIYSIAQPGLPYFTALVSAANTNWNGLQHGYWISEVDQSFNNPVLVNPPIWGVSGFQWLVDLNGNSQTNPNYNQPFQFQRNHYYEIKHGIWNKCKDWKETRHYIYIN